MKNYKKTTGGLNDPNAPLFSIGHVNSARNGADKCTVFVSKFLGNINEINMYEVSFIFSSGAIGGMSTPMYADVSEEHIVNHGFINPSSAKRIVG